MTNKDQNTYISTYMKHKNIFQNRLKSYSEKIHFFSDQTLDIYKFLNTMIFLSVNHNLLYTILGTYPPGPFRNNQNSPKKFSIFPTTNQKRLSDCIIVTYLGVYSFLKIPNLEPYPKRKYFETTLFSFEVMREGIRH